MFRHLDNKLFLGVDIGGSHISAALVKVSGLSVLEESFCKRPVAAGADSGTVTDAWMGLIRETLTKAQDYVLGGIGIAMPGPFDYHEGISLIDGLHKYSELYGINVKQLLKNQLDIADDLPVFFENDAACFGLGELITGGASPAGKMIAVTLGTGFGACFISGGELMRSGKGVPDGGMLYNIPYKDGISEDYISARGLVESYYRESGNRVKEAREIAALALQNEDPAAIRVFQDFGSDIARCIAPWAGAFGAECLVIGGNISRAAQLFLPVLEQSLEEAGILLPVKISREMERSAIAGAASLVEKESRKISGSKLKNTCWRKSSQPLMPAHIPLTREDPEPGKYDIYPFQRIGGNCIFSGYESLAGWMMKQKTVIIDGYGGNDWKAIREAVDRVFKANKIRTIWYETSAFLQPEAEINALVKPFISEPGVVWGKRTALSLADFYLPGKLQKLQAGGQFDITILIGPGAALAGWDAPVVYIDLPKNELQYRMRAGHITNLGAVHPDTAVEMYKRFYFVDWVVMNDHRRKIRNRITVVADGQWSEEITWSFSRDLQKALREAAGNVLRVRPWFEPGAWGGQWLKEHIGSLNRKEVNYAWSFELIVPENGLVFESDGNLLELSFDWLMEQESTAVLGRDADRFGAEFPIRFDFLDTFGGGNLSIQCHPSLSYIHEQFGERITQDETYYIMDAGENAGVYLGFHGDIDPGSFRKDLEQSVEENKPVDIEKYVQLHPSRKHDLFLVPNQTIHSSGINNLVLEISATPYIFTFKMYDWLRLDLNGEPRPINIAHAFNNLDFERKGERVKQELLAKPEVIQSQPGLRVIHLPTHPEHFYDVHRIEFLYEATLSTKDQCHVLMLVEGSSIRVETKNGMRRRFNYAETFIIPAAAESYRLINEGTAGAKVVKAFIK